MSPAEHYAEAERLLDLAENCDWTVEFTPYRNSALTAANVHAILATGAVIAVA